MTPRTDPFITQTRTTETGCYGVFGLWPGRYRVFVDEPPFVFEAEIQVPARGAGGAAKLDGQMTAPPERIAGQPLRPSWYSRLRYYHSYWPEFLVDVVQLAELDTNVNDPEDLAHLNGAVIWQNEPNDWRQHYRVPGVALMFEHERTLQQYEVTTDANGHTTSTCRKGDTSSTSCIRRSRSPVRAFSPCPRDS